MSDRCPHCSARLPEGAPWCGQCYADLRPPAPPEPELAAAAAGPAQPDPLTAPLATLLQASPAAQPAAPAAPRTRPTWPCLACGETNDVDDDRCRRCGAGFLSGVETPDLLLPGIGRAKNLEKGQKVGLVLGGSAAVTLLLIGLAILLGAVT